METLTIFGQVILLVIGLEVAIGVVWSIIQILRLKSQVNSTNLGFDRELQELRRDLYSGINEVENTISNEVSDMNRSQDDTIDQIYRYVDSRFDKFENRIKDKQLLND